MAKMMKAVTRLRRGEEEGRLRGAGLRDAYNSGLARTTIALKCNSCMRTNLRAIAQEAGVHVATVSRALRGLACVDPATGERVREIARRLGYVRDPLLASALTFARRPDKPVYRETIAFLAAVPFPQYKSSPWLSRIHAGATGRAAELGYGIECQQVPNHAREQRQLSRQLRSRGMRGCVICPVSPVAEWESFSLDMDWTHFEGIEVGHALISPTLPRVARNLADDLAAMLNELRVRGYRRIGIAVSRGDEESRRWALLAACLLFKEINPGMHVFTLFRDEADYTIDALERWLRRRRPDVLVVNGPGVMDWLTKMERLIPKQLGVFRIDCVDGCDESGLQTNYEDIGRMAVSQLVSALERGDPNRANTTLLRPVISIQSAWHEGRTLRPHAAI